MDLAAWRAWFETEPYGAGSREGRDDLGLAHGSSEGSAICGLLIDLVQSLAPKAALPLAPPGHGWFRLALPGNDFWLFDDHVIRWGYFSGNGASAGHEISYESTAVTLCANAFDAVWARGIPHDQLTLH